MTLERIRIEFKRILEDPLDVCTAQPLEDENLFLWVGCINGPRDSPYDGGVFYLDIKIPPTYPFKPPKVKFSTPIYHPNISREGVISLDILDQKWCPALTIGTLLLSITSFLTDPNPDDPLEPEIAEIYKTDREMYDNNAMDWTRKFASRLF